MAGGGLALFSMGGEEEPTTGPTTEEGPTTDPTDEPTDEPTTDEPTDEPTTDEPTTDEPTTDEPTGATGLPGMGAYESTPVQDPTDADLEPAKQAMLDYLMGLSNNDPGASCDNQLDPLTGNGITEDSILRDACVESAQGAIDGQGLEGKASHLTTADFEANLDAENRVILVHNIHADDPTPAKLAKGADGQIYLAGV